MHKTESTTDPPHAHSDKSCPRCGCTTLKRVARRLGTGWADYLQCIDCREAIGPLPRPPKPAPEPPPMPAGELSARAGSLDDLTRRAADNLDAICDRAGDIHNVLTARVTTETEEERETMAYTGWQRQPGKRQRWQAVVRAESESEALDQLLALPGGDKVVLPSDRDPNKEARPR